MKALRIANFYWPVASCSTTHPSICNLYGYPTSDLHPSQRTSSFESPVFSNATTSSKVWTVPRRQKEGMYTQWTSLLLSGTGPHTDCRQQCLPEGRETGARCQRCIDKDFECSAPIRITAASRKRQRLIEEPASDVPEVQPTDPSVSSNRHSAIASYNSENPTQQTDKTNQHQPIPREDSENLTGQVNGDPIIAAVTSQTDWNKAYMKVKHHHSSKSLQF